MEINTEMTQKVVLQHQSHEETLATKEEMKKIHELGYNALKQLSTKLKQSVAPISDGVLIRTLTDVGYVSCYKSRGYLGITVAVQMEHIVPKESQSERAEREYTEYLEAEAEKQ